QRSVKLRDRSRYLPQHRVPHLENRSDGHAGSLPAAPASESDRTRQKVLGAEEHLESEPDTEAVAAVLPDVVLRPVDTAAHLHDQPAPYYGPSVGHLQTIVVQRHGRIRRAIDRDLHRDRP